MFGGNDSKTFCWDWSSEIRAPLRCHGRVRTEISVKPQLSPQETVLFIPYLPGAELQNLKLLIITDRLTVVFRVKKKNNMLPGACDSDDTRFVSFCFIYLNILHTQGSGMSSEKSSND